MLKKLKTYLEYGNRFCGVEHTFQNKKDVIYATILKKNKNKIDIENFYEEDSTETIISKLPKKQHIFLIINNDDVLTKRIETDQVEAIKIVYIAFPNINLEDFFYEIVSQYKHHFVSIIRRTNVEELTFLYKKNDISVVNISIGNNIISSVFDYIDLDSKYILTSNSCLSIVNKAISSIKKQETDEEINYDVNGLTVSNNKILSLSGALNTILHNFQPISNLGLLKQPLKNDFIQSRFYTQILKLGLLFLLGVLLINFFTFNYYYNKVNTLQQTSQINQTTKQKILELNRSVSKSQKMIEDMLKGSSSKSSFFVNTIVQNLPNSILLSELNFQPILKRIKENQSIETDSNIFLISGESNNSKLFSTFINNLESIQWIKNVEVLNYEDTSKTASNFSIKLNIGHE